MADSTEQPGTILAIDGGGTRTRAGLYTQDGTLLAEAEGEATNLTSNRASESVQIISGLAAAMTSKSNARITAAVAGISGAGRTGQAGDVKVGLAEVLSTDEIRVCSDAHMLSWANLDAEHPVLVIAGTGSVVIARKTDGTRVVTGGWGPILGDDGSAYRLALEGIRCADEDAELRQRIVEATSIDFVHIHLWLKTHSVTDIAEIAVLITKEAENGNAGAIAAVRNQAERLGALTQHGAKRAGIDASWFQNPIVLVSGGMFDSQQFLDEFATSFAHDSYTVRVERPKLTGHRAALELLRLPLDASIFGKITTRNEIPFNTKSTEDVLKWGEPLDQLPTEGMVRQMYHAEGVTTICVGRAKDSLALIVDASACCIRAGGRIVYAGAGTSGRLGVLDASECPPTFGVGEDRVIALIAGGDAALRHSIEGAEDDTAAAARDIDAISPRIGANDIVIGITASGTTPYALAAIDRAKQLGAKTGLVACNPVPLDRADFVVALDTGPEVLPGSTRLKAGTATKLVLNQISTGAMAKAGYVLEGRMVGVRPLNKKLRQRCIRIIAELTKEDAAAAEKRLDETGGSIRLAVLMARRNLTLDEARRRLDAANGVLRDALEAG